MKKLIILCLLIVPIVASSQELSDKKILSKAQLSELKLMFENDQKYRNIISDQRESLSKAEIDSLWSLQDKIDLYNTKRVIEIIKKHGYVSSINSNNNVAPLQIILAHSPNVLKESVASIIDIENKAGRISKSSYGLIKWHLNDRPRPNIKINFEQKNDSLNKQ